MPTDDLMPAPEDAPPEKPLNAVIVIREVADDGSIRAIPMIQGDLDPLAVQTLLEKAIQGWREQIGLPPR